ncbi:MAG TPA: phage major capsid protein [Candidatus Caccousia avicola]|uniref:Phage major capsid protein n=1 Tax=Candidatus Caccousia avicola TaxID=2840721 RepID=A0A9D1DG20_9FIRM|nr:phage major capsid protein [Candidatus Caccousia avicola]
MALKALLLRRSIDSKNEMMKQLMEKDESFRTREKELEAAIMEAATDDDRAAVDQEVEKFEAEKSAHEDEKQRLAQEIEGLEADLEKLEEETPAPAASSNPPKERKDSMNLKDIKIRSLPMQVRAFDALTHEQRNAIVARDDVKEFLSRLRSMKGQTRDVSGAELTIPIVFLDLIAENMFRYSKLLNRVRVRNVNGQARQTIAGTVPEAVWTEMCGAINELTFVFNQITVDGYKVAGFVPVCNSVLEDNDVGLAGWIVEMLSESVGLAMDKAIIYGKGAASKMPLGIVTRLAQSAQPENYPANAPAWVDLHTSNILKVDSSQDAVTFWAALAVAAGNTYTKYARGTQFWAMNSKTLATLKSKLITFAASGELLARFNGVMPIIDGDVDVLEFMPDGDIVGGYGDLYLLALRSGMTIESSREVQFLQDNTVFKGKQRADGQPVIPGAFVAININNVNVTTAMTFAADTANNAMLQSLSIGNETLSPVFDSDTYAYTIATASNASDKIEATTAQAGAQVAISYNGTNVRNGGTVTWTADSKAHPLTVTVTQGNSVRVYTVQVTKAGG